MQQQNESIVNKKVVLLGDSSVGKTSLIRRYIQDVFDDAYIMTIGSKVSRREMKILKEGEETKVNLMIWDVLGREGYSSLHSRTFAGVHGAILVSDITRHETLGTLERYWTPLLFKVVDYIPLVFVCNKTDLADKAAYDPKEMYDIASKYNAGFSDELPPDYTTNYQTSAKTGKNVNKAFESLSHMMLSKKIPLDPIKELYESLIAMGVYRQSDKTTLIGALDAILVDFCEGFDDDRLAMSLIRQETVRAGIDVRQPTKDGLLKVVEYFAEVEAEYLDETKVNENRKRRMQWAKDAKE